VIKVLRVYKNADTLAFMLNDSHKKSKMNLLIKNSTLRLSIR
jgi:hypothetical protein